MTRRLRQSGAKTNTHPEIRTIEKPQTFEIRSNPDGSRSITGYAATFGDLSEDLGNFKEVVQRGAFKKSLAETNPDVLCLFSHDSSKILGRVSSGTLIINEDAKGLKFTCHLPNTSFANDLVESMSRSDISKMSFGFVTAHGGDTWTEVDNQIIRTLTEVVLFEVSVVGQPAYNSSSVSLRSIPAEFRKRVNADKIDSIIFDNDEDDDEEEDDDSDDEERCSCECAVCADGNCDQCSDSSCHDENCEACPMQADTLRADNLRIRALFANRRKSSLK